MRSEQAEFYRRTRATLETYRRDHPRFLSQHHLESYDDFIERRMPDIVRSLQWTMVKEDVTVRVYVGGKDGARVFLDRPTVVVSAADDETVTRVLYPNEARLKGLTYAANIYADIDVEYTTTAAASGKGGSKGKGEGEGSTTTTRTFPAHRIGVIPIMLHSRICPLRSLPHAALTAAGECPYDQGGYFVVGGREKVVIAQEEVAVNRLFFTQVQEVRGADGKPASDHVSHRARLRCMPDVGSTFPKVVSFSVLGASSPDPRLIGAIRVQVPYVYVNGKDPTRLRDIPLFVLFRALGVESDADIFDTILGRGAERSSSSSQREAEFLRACALEAAMPSPASAAPLPPIHTQAAALAVLAGGTRYGALNGSWDNLKSILEADFLPNATPAEDRGGAGFAAKAVYLGYLARRVVRVVLGSERPDDRDHFVNRRVQLAGALIGDLFRDLWLVFHRTALDRMDQEYEYNSKSARTVTTLVTPSNLRRIFSAEFIDTGMLASFRGTWGAGGLGLSGTKSGTGDFDKNGIVQELARVSYFSYASHVRRVTQRDVGIKQADPRKLLPSQWGSICPVDTPDGSSIGLVKHLALLCHIVNAPHDTRPLLQHLAAIGLTESVSRLHPQPPLGDAVVTFLVNDSLRGYTRSPAVLVSYLRHLRRCSRDSDAGLMGRYTSVYWDVPGAQIKLQADAGRCCRPLYIVPPRTPTSRPLLPAYDAVAASRLSWEAMLRHGNDNDMGVATSRQDVDRRLRAANDHGARGVPGIEYIDTQETMNALIAVTTADLTGDATAAAKAFTHCEIHAATVLSAVTAALPLMNHQNAAYTALSLAQTKQAIGVYATNYATRMDTLALVLHYPQRPLVGTSTSDWMFGGNLAHGENLVVAVMCFTGYNQDDGFVLNQDSVDRGMFNLTQFETHTFDEVDSAAVSGEGGAEQGAVRVFFADPGRIEAEGHEVLRSHKHADGGGLHLDANGMPLPGTVLGDGDVLVGMVQVSATPSAVVAAAGPGGGPAVVARDDLVFDEGAARRAAKQLNNRGLAGDSRTFRDVSEVLDRPQGGVVVVDRVYVRAANGADDDAGGVPRHAKVCVRQMRVPCIGDKLASRFAQKGTVGLMVRAGDMPFGHTSGMVPDIVLNPNAFPKRMTMGHLVEALLAKRCAAAGSRANADTFEPREDWADPEASCALETHAGLHRLGDEVMYCGRTGEQLDCDIFLALNYVGRLKHMTEDKVNSRAREGTVAMLTRQPAKGRAAHGGLRVGEMEQQCLLAHGTASTLKEAFMERSDGTTHVIDTRTGISAKASHPAIGLVRAVDGDATGHRDFTAVRIPHSLRLLQHELCAMAVDTRLVTVSEGDGHAA